MVIMFDDRWSEKSRFFFFKLKRSIIDDRSMVEDDNRGFANRRNGSRTVITFPLDY